MDQALEAQLTVMRSEVQASAIPDDCKETAFWCIGQLPPLYSKLHLTNESRYGDEIARLVRGLMIELAKDAPARTAAPKRSMSIPERLQGFHEKFGLPRLNVKLPAAPVVRRVPKLRVSG